MRLVWIGAAGLLVSLWMGSLGGVAAEWALVLRGMVVGYLLARVTESRHWRREILEQRLEPVLCWFTGVFRL